MFSDSHSPHCLVSEANNKKRMTSKLHFGTVVSIMMKDYMELGVACYLVKKNKGSSTGASQD